WVIGAEDLEELEDPQAQGFPLLARRGADERDQTGEGSAGIAADDLGVGGGLRRFDVRGVRLGGGDEIGRFLVDASAAASGSCETELRLRIGRQGSKGGIEQGL